MHSSGGADFELARAAKWGRGRPATRLLVGLAGIRLAEAKSAGFKHVAPATGLMVFGYRGPRWDPCDGFDRRVSVCEWGRAMKCARRQGVPRRVARRLDPTESPMRPSRTSLLSGPPLAHGVELGPRCRDSPWLVYC